MKLQYLDGQAISDDASRVCLLFDPKNGRVVHAHGITVLHGGHPPLDAEMETRARAHSERLGKPASALRALHLPLATVRQHGELRVNERGDGLVPSPPKSMQARREARHPSAG